MLEPPMHPLKDNAEMAPRARERRAANRRVPRGGEQYKWEEVPHLAVHPLNFTDKDKATRHVFHTHGGRRIEHRGASKRPIPVKRTIKRYCTINTSNPMRYYANGFTWTRSSRELSFTRKRKISNTFQRCIWMREKTQHAPNRRPVQYDKQTRKHLYYDTGFHPHRQGAGC